MKTISAFTETAIDNPYVDVIRLIEITIGSITLYLCDRIFGDDDLCVFNGQLYEPLIASWDAINMGRINPVTYAVEPGSAGFSVINSQPVGGADCFSALFSSNDPQYCPVLISEIHAGASIADDKEDVFKGGIEDLPGMTVDLVNVSCTGYELAVASKFIHTIVDDTTYPGADPDDIGKMVPQIYGTVQRSPALAVDAGGRTTLAESMSATKPTNGYTFNVTDASALPSAGAFTVQIDSEQIRIASRSGNTLTLAISGARGYNSTTAAPHDMGAQLSEIQSDYVYMLADHAVHSISGVFVDNIRQILGAQPDEYTVLLLHANGDDASTDFPDEGSTIHPVTANGNAQVDTQKVFGTGSLLLDGTGDYLSVPYHADWTFGTGDFTIDFRIRFNTYADKSSGLFKHGDDYNMGYWFLYYNSGATGRLRFYIPGTPTLVIDADWISNPSGWYHIALVRSGNTFYIFVDGVQKGTDTNACDLEATQSDDFVIGRSLKETDQYPSEYYYLDGWIDEFRVSKGTARWTSAFTPPIQAYPYASHLIPDTYTKLLIQADGADASTNIDDESVMNHAVSVQGNAQVDTQKVFGTGSLLLDGTGDYLSVPYHADWTFGTGDFTIDFRIRFNTYADKSSGLFKHGDDYNMGYWFLYYNSGATGRLRFYIPGTPTLVIDADWISNPSGWYHIALVRSGNTFYIFVDGVQKGTDTNACDLEATQGDDFVIGRSLKETDQYPSEYYYLDGWIDEFRVSKGTARWTSAFTPPTLPYRWGDSAGGGDVTITAYTGQSGDEYSGYSQKAVVVFSVLPTLEKQINIDVTDSGHTHGTPPGDSGTANVSLSGNSTAETIIGNKISADLDGHLDDGSGTYTGTPSALIERPDHISKHLIIVCCGLTTTEIHAASYIAAGTFFSTNSYILGFPILERPNVRKLLHRIASQAKAMQFWGAGKHYISPIETSPSMDKAIDDHRVDQGQIWLKYTDRINIKNKLTARYSRQWSGHANEVESDRAIVIASDATSIATFGTLQGDPESYPYINGETQAQAMLNWKLADSKASRLIAELAGGYYLSDIERGDIIRFDNMYVIGETINTGYLVTLSGDYLTTLAGDRLLWWSTTAEEDNEFLKAAMLGLVTMGSTLFRVIDKAYRPDTAIQIEAVKI